MLRNALREKTKSHHERLEKSLALTEPGLTAERYLDCLKRFYGFHLPIERELGAVEWAARGLDFEARRKVPLLERDLRAFGVGSQALAALPVCELISGLRDPVRGLGCLYVLEGSTLGGQILSRHFHSKFGYTAQNGCAYFSSYGQSTPWMWRTFVDFLDAQNLSEKDRDEVISSACETFRALELWFSSAA